MNWYLFCKILWYDCGMFQCVDILVLLDWDNLDGLVIILVFKCKLVEGVVKVIFFINFGGLGGFGQDMVSFFQLLVFFDYDVIGWDLCGMGVLIYVNCGFVKMMDGLFSLDVFFDDEVEWNEFICGIRDFVCSCCVYLGQLLDYVLMIDIVCDFDYLRYLVGNKKFDYFGVLYGIFFGVIYVELYLGCVGYMVLDLMVNIMNYDIVSQVVGFD